MELARLRALRRPWPAAFLHAVSRCWRRNILALRRPHGSMRGATICAARSGDWRDCGALDDPAANWRCSAAAVLHAATADLLADHGKPHASVPLASAARLLARRGAENSARHRLELFEELWIARFGGGNQRIVERPIGTDRTWFVLTRKIAGEPRNQALGFLRIGEQHLDDVLDRDGVVIGMPAIEIGHHGDGGVANLRFARELGLRHVGHADHGVTEFLVSQAFGEARELRPLDAHVSAIARQ